MNSWAWSATHRCATCRRRRTRWASSCHTTLVIPTLRDAAERGAGSGIVISAGFSERGVEDRRELQAELGQVARETGVRISGPNCLGLANIKDDILGLLVVATGGSGASQRQRRD